VLTELILENTLGGYEPEEVVALLSCFVFQEKTEAEPLLTGRLESGRDAIIAIADRVGGVQDMHRVVRGRTQSGPQVWVDRSSIRVGKGDGE
jgi:antiviral helicase SKI2